MRAIEIELLDLAEQIALEVAADPRAGATLNLASGLSGHALFFAHLSRVRNPKGKFSTLALNALERIVEELPRQNYARLGLYTGVAGIAWVVEHVATKPEFRRRGLVERLVHATLEAGREKGATVADIGVLLGNDPAQRAYEKCGFEVVDEVRNAEFEAAYGSAGARMLRRSL